MMLQSCIGPHSYRGRDRTQVRCGWLATGPACLSQHTHTQLLVFGRKTAQRQHTETAAGGARPTYRPDRHQPCAAAYVALLRFSKPPTAATHMMTQTMASMYARKYKLSTGRVANIIRQFSFLHKSQSPTT